MWTSRAQLASFVLAIAAAGCSTESGDAQTAQPALGAGNCDNAVAGGGWLNDFTMQQYKRFITTLQARPDNGGSPIDAVIGWSNGPATTFSQLGAIVRFNPAGEIDARDGSTYHATEHVGYRSDNTELWWVQMDIDLSRHRYTAWAQLDGASTGHYIGQDFAFRTEQAGLARIDNIAAEVDSSSGVLQICNAVVNYMDDECITAQAGTPWGAVPVRSATGHFTLQTRFEPGFSSTTDAVIGLSRGMPTGFTSLAAILRLNPNGTFDVRDGGTYRADATVAWQTDRYYQAYFDVDITTHTYSVWVGLWNNPPMTRIAYGYHFRNEQAQVASLDTLGVKVDSSAGFIAACDVLQTY